MGMPFPLAPDGGLAEQREALEGRDRGKDGTTAHGQGVTRERGSHESPEVREQLRVRGTWHLAGDWSKVMWRESSPATMDQHGPVTIDQHNAALTLHCNYIGCGVRALVRVMVVLCICTWNLGLAIVP